MSGQLTSENPRHRAIVDRIVADLQPVRPRWPIGVRLALWLLVDLAVAVWVIDHGRSDLASMLHRPDYLLELLLFGGASFLAAHLALRSAVPGLTLSKVEICVILVLASAGTLLLTRVPMRSNYGLDSFVNRGLRCAFGTTLFATAPWIGLAWIVTRSAPLRGFVSGALVGSGAAFFSFALMRIDCPLDEPLHLFAWHVAPAIALIAISTLIGGPLLRFRPSFRLGSRTP